MKKSLEQEIENDLKQKKTCALPKKAVKIKDPSSMQSWKPFFAGWGNGSLMQLTGKPLKSRCILYPMVIDVQKEREENIISEDYALWKGVSCGGQSTYAFDKRGRVYSWGSGILGRKPAAVESPWILPGFGLNIQTTVVEIAVGSQHVLARTRFGTVYSWGSTKSGALGLGEVSRKLIPTQIPDFEKKFITRIACGENHSACVSIHSELYTFGEGVAGQLGLGDMKGRSRPTKVEGVRNVSRISCGQRHTAIICCAISTAGEGFCTLWTCGYGEYGRLGIGNEETMYSPALVNGLTGTSVEKVCCGSLHTLVIDETGEVWAFGWNQYGQVGTDSDQNIVLVPIKVAGLVGIKISEIACGFSHSLALSQAGELYTWGFGEEGQLGQGSEENSHIPCLVEKFCGLRVFHVSASHCHSFAVCEKKGFSSEKVEWQMRLRKKLAARKIEMFYLWHRKKVKGTKKFTAGAARSFDRKQCSSSPNDTLKSPAKDAREICLNSKETVQWNPKRGVLSSFSEDLCTSDGLHQFVQAKEVSPPALSCIIQSKNSLSTNDVRRGEEMQPETTRSKTEAQTNQAYSTSFRSQEEIETPIKCCVEEDDDESGGGFF